eukprot:TRINITY_DN29198_c0_g1_i1.p1 TRINITY_DN29198_c0_g1~~TRINITY_DN29198_c0_g1_i1.p1  ORF type:complete len:441 (-),score=47.20 TRINITY_DN29198_c0_g1_i1:118-1440(-)
MAHLQYFLLLLLLLPSLSWVYPAQGSRPRCTPVQHGSGSGLTILHPYGPCTPFSKSVSWDDVMLGLVGRDEARVLYLTSLAVGGKKEKKSFVPIASGRPIFQSGTYVVRMSVGTPPQTLLMAMDISNDAAWIPCSGCVGCSSTVFDTTNSSSYKSLDCQAPQCKQAPNPSCDGSACSFNLTYGGSSFRANLSQDTLTLASDAVPAYTFGCLQAVTGTSLPPQGLLGLGRGPSSLLSQTQDLFHSTFSYCLPNFKSINFSGTLRLGTANQPTHIKTTPLLKNPRRPSLYYVNMTGVSIAKRMVNIPPSALAFDPTTGGGTILDSGTAVTRLVEPAYTAVRDEVRRQVNGTVSSLGGFDTCYDGQVVWPAMTLHFNGMDVKLAVDNLIIRSTSGNISCLAMAAAPANVNSVVNVIASMQQQNLRVLFDVPNSKVGVAREICT